MAADLSIIIKAVDQASGTIDGVQRELGGLEKGAGKLGGILKGGLMVGAGAAIAGIGALGAVLATSVDAASEAEDIGAQLNAVLKSTGGIAGVTADAINDHALALSEVTRFEDDAIVSAQSLLLTFTKIGKDIFPDATEATLDMAQAMKMDLKSASMLVGKALNDPIKGMTALTRSGIQFTEEQKAMVEAMVAVGNTAGAQQIILKELETQFGGSARAAGETLSGQLEILKNQFGNVKEEIGGALIPIIKDLVGWLGPRVVTGFQRFSGWFRTTVTDIQAFVTNADKAKDIIGDIVADVTAGQPINWQDLMNLSGLFTNELDVKRTFGRIVKDIEENVLRIKGAFDEGGVWGAVGEIGQIIGEAIAKIDWNKIKIDLTTAANKALTAIELTWDEIVLTVKKINWDQIATEIKRIAGEAWTIYSDTFRDPNKQAMLAWDIQYGIKQAFAQVQKLMEADADDTAVSGIASSLADSFRDGFAEALRGPTAGTQDFVALILDYMFPDFVERLAPIRNFFFNLQQDINHVKEALSLGRSEKQLFDEKMGEAVANPFQAIADVINEVIKALQGARKERTEFSSELSYGLTNPFAAIADVINNIIGLIQSAIDKYNELKSAFGSGSSYGGTPTGQPGGAGYGSTPSGPTGGAGYGATPPGRGADAGGLVFNITINAAGGNPQAVAVAVETGVMAAARSMGLA